MVAIRKPKSLCFDFDLPKDVDKNLKYETEFILKRKDSFPQNKINIEIKELLLKYKDRNNIHEDKKQQNE